MFIYKAGIIATSATVLVVAEAPIPFVDEFTKFGVCGALVFVIYLLIIKHSEAIKIISGKMDEMKAELKTSSDRQCQLLESALVRTYKLNQDK
jgi:hypothetical protein